MRNAKYKLLFVEDDPEMSAVYQENFTNPQFEATVARNGREALDLLQQNSKNYFDLVITDNYMPQMSGVTLLKKIREEFPNLKVILITGYGNWDDFIQAEESGAVRFLDKPIKMSQLRKLIESLIRNEQESSP